MNDGEFDPKQPDGPLQSGRSTNHVSRRPRRV